MNLATDEHEYEEDCQHELDNEEERGRVANPTVLILTEEEAEDDAEEHQPVGDKVENLQALWIEEVFQSLWAHC